ncbi:MAG TPA: maleylpyruvate isomerase family mycothiol-dependent enzyme [Acidimicrobiales bacterium]|jgi:uncharacterized protein (TIGR03083 family)
MGNDLNRPTPAQLALRELDQCRALLSDTDDWSAATPCEGWDVEALARHIAAVAWQQAEAFHRGRVGIAEAPSWLAATGGREELLTLLEEARRHLSVTEAIDDSATVPLPVAPLRAPIATSVLVLEYGVHRADLERSLLGAPADQLDPSVARTVAGLLPGLVPLLVEKPPAAAVTYRLRGDSTTVAITYEGDAWRPGEGDGGTPVCEIRGSDAAVALLVLGRIGADHPALETNDPAAASALPQHIRRL